MVWFYERHSGRYRHKLSDSHHNLMKSLRNCRTGNQDPNSESTKGDKSQELACRLYGWNDLNKENDNYTGGTPIDCYDPKTMLYHQVQGRCYNYISRLWAFSGFEREWIKIFEDMVCFCFSKDEKIVERIYRFPEKVVKNKKGVRIVKYDSRGNVYNNGWYEQYRIIDEETIKKANDICKEIIRGNLNDATYHR